MKKIAILCSLLLGALFPVAAQYDNIWLMGPNASIDFNVSPPIGKKVDLGILGLTPQSPPLRTIASVCDINGQLLFYTEGTNVVDRQHNKMPNGDGLVPLLGPTGYKFTVTEYSSQGAIIVPIPGQEDKYYIFSLTSLDLVEMGTFGWLYYSVVDMSLNGGLGDVVAGQKGIFLDSNLADGMTVMPGANCNIWLLTFGRHDRQFRSFDISSSGLNPVPVRSGPLPGVYMMKGNWFGASPDRTKFAWGSYDHHLSGGGNDHLIADTFTSGLFLFDINACSGIISNPQRLVGEDVVFPGMFPVFSPNSKVLYASTYQWNLAAGGLTDVINSKTNWMLSTGEALAWQYAKKLGPDGKIYFWDYLFIGYEEARYGVINFPNELGEACKADRSFKWPRGSFADWQAVSAPLVHIDNKKDTVYTSTKDTAQCFAKEHTIAAFDKNACKYKWNTGDTTASLKVKQSGLYWVRYYVECTYHIDTFYVYFPSGPLDFRVQASCSNYANGAAWITKLEEDSIAYSFSWRAAADTVVLSTTDSLTGVPSGQYKVTIKTIGGCTETITVTITEENGQVSFDADTLLCAGDTVFFKNTSDDHFQTWHWSFGDSTSTSFQQEEHVYREEGRYRVILVGQGSLCVDTAYATITVDAPAKDLSFEAIPYTVCQGETIHFKAKMPESPVHLLWDLGDENKVTTQSVVDIQHAYDNSGVKRVMLNASYRICPAITYQDSIVVYGLPKIDLGPDSVLCLNGSSLILSNHNTSSGGMAYLWSTGETTETIKVLHPGSYSLTLSEPPLGCSSTEAIEVKKDCNTDVPNVFTPNGDGLNDYFFPRQFLSKSIKSFRMAVFNRSGGKVFETQSIDGRGWDGNFNAQPQPQGVYVYRVEMELDNNQFERYDGNITLLR